MRAWLTAVMLRAVPRCCTGAVLWVAMGLGLAATTWAETPLQAQQACEQLMRGESANEQEGARYRHYAAVAGVSSATLCSCVGAAFAPPPKPAAGTPKDGALLLQKQISACLPHFGALAPAQQKTILDGPLYAQPPQRAQINAEVQLCRAMAQGRYASPSLDTLYLRAWEQASGMQAADLCGGCVVADLDDRRDNARENEQLWDKVRLEQELVQALHSCQHRTFHMPMPITD